MTNISLGEKAIISAKKGIMAFCRFITANDTGYTGSHQYGIYLPKILASHLFSSPPHRGENITKNVDIKWQDDFITKSNFKYYSRGTKNEYRLTKFGIGFELLKPEKTGSLLVLVKETPDNYDGFILEHEDDINTFLDYFGMSPSDTGNIINTTNNDRNNNHIIKQHDMIMDFIHSLNGQFPVAKSMSAKAREIQGSVFNHNEEILTNPDRKILAWLDTEYMMFKDIEEALYGDIIANGFNDMQTFLDMANSVLNRRKSRAGKSLEYHLEALFDGNNLQYDSQAITEVKKKPDFLFPGSEAYHNIKFPSDKLIVLGAKTTCKDRWRQVVTEADRVKTKYLCTLQQGISANQLKEMKAENVKLVVPKQYISYYPKEYQEDILTIKNFIEFVQEVQKG